MAILASCVAVDAIPSHPNAIHFNELTYNPPNPEDFRVVLANGTIGYIAEDHTAPVVEISLLIRCGSYLDPAEKAGLAAMTVELMRSGGTTRMTPDRLNERIDYLAASIDTDAGLTSSTATLFVLSKDIDEGFGLCAEILKTPAFNEEEIKLYKERVISAMKERNDRISAIATREFNLQIYGDHPQNRYSTRESINAIVRDDLVSFHKKYIHPKNMIVAVSGDIAREKAIKLLEKSFDGWESPQERVATITAPTNIPAPGLYLIDKSGVAQGSVVIGHTGIDMRHPDVAAVAVMNSILGGGSFTSRITKKIRSDEGLTYSIGSSFSPGEWYPGTFEMRFSSKGKSCLYATSLAVREARIMASDKVSDEEIATAKSAIIESFPRRFTSRYETMKSFAYNEFVGRPMDYYRAYRDRIRNVTKDDILRVAKNLLKPDKFVIVIAGPIDEIRKGDGVHTVALDDFGATKILPIPDPYTMQRPKNQ